MTTTQTFQNTRPPVLIFGAPRSGTSLLSRLLDAHSQIAIPFESHLFNQWSDRVDAYGALAHPENRRRLIKDIIRFGVIHDWTPRPVADEVAALVRGDDFAAIARAFMEWAAQTEGKPRWGEKTPHHTLLNERVLKAWPEAQVIIIHRDPRDVALSWKQARFGGNHVMPFAKSWVSYMKACEVARQSLEAENLCEIRYDALVRDPRGTLERIMAFLGEDFEDGQLAFHEARDDWKTDARNQAQLRQPVSPDSIGRWKSGLSDRELQIVEAVAGEMMERHEYERAVPDANLSAGTRLFIKLVEQPIQRGLGLFKNARGFVYVWRDFNWTVRRVASRPFRTG